MEAHVTKSINITSILQFCERYRKGDISLVKESILLYSCFTVSHDNLQEAEEASHTAPQWIGSAIQSVLCDHMYISHLHSPSDPFAQIMVTPNLFYNSAAS